MAINNFITSTHCIFPFLKNIIYSITTFFADIYHLFS
ncbi:hypothetical protein YPC_1719 [Yersinia pestis biovar Medievalis str. Harbin 35]|nr:hypothetical protein YPC_1719 [Yersinia pestis biovar Medievalis str. Harbin 35]EEO76639.1 hypothetical protein YP516_2239 [Yersinia pestis Nepal516]EEO81391.1 hypothetical protein YPF_2116 [Yersinia pestis biovar Orientalis str. India 195]EEO90500.1 hypothetical protein YPS_2240 [Yersinia pestis Pestoides A]